MTEDDISSVLAIENSSFPSPWTRTAFASHLDHPEFAKYIVATVKNELVGYVGLFFGGGQGQITNLAVHPDWRRHRIGTRLLVEISDYSFTLGLEGLSLEVRTSNIDAQHLYEKFGFVKVGLRKNYYQEINEDAYVMCIIDMNKPDIANRLNSIKKELHLI